MEQGQKREKSYDHKDCLELKETYLITENSLRNIL
jgi:hypothetical protein